MLLVRTIALAALLAATPLAAHADCSKAAIRKLRADADKAVTAKDFAKAIGLLEPMLAACPVDGAPTDRGWLVSDLSVAYEKAGRLLDCQRLLAPYTHPSSPTTNTAKLHKALQHNLEQCGKALDTKYAAIKAGKCSLPLDHAVASAALPAALVPKGASAACIALLPGTPSTAKKSDDDPSLRDVVCPVATLVWKTDKLERQPLTLVPGTDTAGPLDDDSVCCNLSAIAAGTLDGKTLVRVRGGGRDCNGGTADTDSDMFYELAGKTLKPAVDASVAYH